MVIKGVNKRIIEVIHTDCDYFEKAILFLNPNRMDEDKEKILGVAKGYLGALQYKEKKSFKRKIFLRRILQASLVFLLGMGVATLLLWKF